MQRTPKSPREIVLENRRNATAGSPGGVLWLHDIRSRHNVGAMFRTADALGLGGLLLSGHTPGPDTDDLSKTALGAERSVRFRRIADPESEAEKLRAGGLEVIALEQTTDSVPLGRIGRIGGGGWCLVAGSEVMGLEPRILNLCDRVVHIDQYGTKHSLNVAVAAALAVYVLQTRG